MDTRTELKDYATKYTIGEFDLIWRGKGWGIYKKDFNRCCYESSIKRFIVETLPSNRDETFFKLCRFGLIEMKRIIDELQKSAPCLKVEPNKYKIRK